MRARLQQAVTSDMRAGLLLLGASLLVHLPAWASGLIPIEDDVRVFYFPLLVATSDALAQGTLPLWTPSIFGGYPLFADGEAGMLYPLHLVLLPWLQPEASLVVLRLVHSALASIFMYVLLRDLGVRALGSLVGALVFAHSGFAAGQIVHNNLFHSMVWLPLELALTERALRAAGARRYRYAALTGVIFGVQALACHIQITLLSGLLIGLFVGYRSFLTAAGGLVPRWPWARRERPPATPGAPASRQCLGSALGAVAIVGVIGVLGSGLAAVQLLPLFELGTQSARGSGLDRTIAATNSVWPGGLLTLLLPRLYDTGAGGFWGPWVKWETLLYVGIAPLALAPVGLIAQTGPYRGFFGGLGTLALLVTLGPHAPASIWAFLYDLPGFSVLQSAGRFALLLTLAVAVLTAYGVDWLAHRPRPHPRLALGVVLGGGALVASFGLVLTLGSHRLREAAVSGAAFLDAYLALPGIPWMVDEAPLTAQRVGSMAAHSLSPATPETAWQLGLLCGVVLVLTLWLLGPRVRWLAASATVLLLGVDLAVLWLTTHPYGRVADLRPVVPAPLVAAPGELFRIFTPPTTADKLTQVEPNRLLIVGVHEAGGYSSVQPARHAAYAQAVQQVDDHLLDLWNVRYRVQRLSRLYLPSYALTSFEPDRPLLSGRRGSSGSSGTLLPDGGPARADGVRVIAALSGAESLSTGVPVARLVLTDPEGETRTLALQAGQHVADSRIATPGHTPPVQHAPVEVAYQFQRTNPQGARYGEQLSYAYLPLDPPMRVSRISVEHVQPAGGLELYGLGLLDGQTGEVTQVRDNARFRPVYRDRQIRILENTAVLPRAFVVERAVQPPPGRDLLGWMRTGEFDPRTTVVVEEASAAGLAALPPAGATDSASTAMATEAASPTPAPGDSTMARRPLQPAMITSYRDQEVIVQVTAERDGYLVLSDPYFPGWVARVDERPVPIVRANYLFRAVPVPAGTHTVTFHFESLTIARGAALSLLAFLVVLAVAAGHGLAVVRERLSAWQAVPAKPANWPAARNRRVARPGTTALGSVQVTPRE